MGLFESGPTLQICSPNHTWIRWHWLSLRQFSSSKSWGQQCPYRVLGLSQNADIKSIKAAYISLSKKYHPDVNTSPQAGDQFRAVSEAYEVIGSAVAKKRYDDKLAAERRQNPYKSYAQSRGGTHPPPRPPKPPDNIHVRWENYLNEEKLNRERRAQYVRMRKNPFNVLDRDDPHQPLKREEWTSERYDRFEAWFMKLNQQKRPKHKFEAHFDPYIIGFMSSCIIGIMLMLRGA